METIEDLVDRYRAAKAYLLKKAGLVALCFPDDLAIEAIAKMQEERNLAAVMLADAVSEREEKGDVDRDPAVETES